MDYMSFFLNTTTSAYKLEKDISKINSLGSDHPKIVCKIKNLGASPQGMNWKIPLKIKASLGELNPQ